MVALLSYAAVLSLIHRGFKDELDRFVPLAVCAALVMLLGLYFGGKLCELHSGWTKQYVFVCGLLCPYAIFTLIGGSVAIMTGIQDVRSNAAGGYLRITQGVLLFLPSVAVWITVGWAESKRRE